MPFFTSVSTLAVYLFLKFKWLAHHFTHFYLYTCLFKLVILYFTLLDSIRRERKTYFCFAYLYALLLGKSLHYLAFYFTQDHLTPYENALQYNIVAMEGLPPYFTLYLALAFLLAAKGLRLLFFRNTGFTATLLGGILLQNDNSFFLRKKYTFKVTETVCSHLFGYSPSQQLISVNIQKLTIFLLFCGHLSIIFISKFASYCNF